MSRHTVTLRSGGSQHRLRRGARSLAGWAFSWDSANLLSMETQEPVPNPPSLQDISAVVGILLDVSGEFHREHLQSYHATPDLDERGLADRLKKRLASVHLLPSDAETPQLSVALENLSQRCGRARGVRAAAGARHRLDRPRRLVGHPGLVLPSCMTSRHWTSGPRLSTLAALLAVVTTTELFGSDGSTAGRTDHHSRPATRWGLRRRQFLTLSANIRPRRTARAPDCQGCDGATRRVDDHCHPSSGAAVSPIKRTSAPGWAGAVNIFFSLSRRRYAALAPAAAGASRPSSPGPLCVKLGNVQIVLGTRPTAPVSGCVTCLTPSPPIDCALVNRFAPGSLLAGLAGPPSQRSPRGLPHLVSGDTTRSR